MEIPKLKNAISFAGENASLTEILKFLPESANLFIAAFQAMAVFLEVNQFKTDDRSFGQRKFCPIRFTLQVKSIFSRFQKCWKFRRNSLDFSILNTGFTIVPVKGKYSKLAVPDGYWDDFVLWQDSVYNAYDSSLFQHTTQKIEYPPAPGRQYLGETVKNLQIEGKTKIKYILQSGDVLGIIAEKYDVHGGGFKILEQHF
jgi:membrane-bound lytic murein transglycosylase D